MCDTTCRYRMPNAQRIERKITEKEAKVQTKREERRRNEGKSKQEGRTDCLWMLCPFEGTPLERYVSIFWFLIGKGGACGEEWKGIYGWHRGLVTGDRLVETGWCLQGTIPARRGVDAVQKT